MFPTEPPNSPHNLRLNEQSTSISVSWSSPTETGGRSDLYYQVEYSDPDVLGTFIARYTRSTSYTITALEPHTSYCIRVSAHNGVSDQDPDRSQSRTVEECTRTDEGSKFPQSVSQSVVRFVGQSVGRSVGQSVSQSVSLSVCLSVCLSLCLPLCGNWLVLYV